MMSPVMILVAYDDVVVRCCCCCQLTEFKEQLFYAAGVPPERILEFACGE